MNLANALVFNGDIDEAADLFTEVIRSTHVAPKVTGAGQLSKGRRTFCRCGT